MNKRQPTERKIEEMPFQLSPSRSFVLASVLAAGLVLTVASCSHVTPLGPTPQPHQAVAAVASPVVAPAAQHLRSPITLQAVLVQKPTAAGNCPAGYAALSGGGSGCYRKTGTPVTFTSAGVSSAQSSGLAAGQPNTRPGYGVLITVPAVDAQALQIVTTTAYNAHGAVAISVAGKVWSIPMALEPLTTGQFQIQVQSKSQALQLENTLTSSG